MCSFQDALPFVALAVLSASDWESMARAWVRDRLGKNGGEQ